MELREQVERLMETAKFNLQKDGELMSCALVFSGEDNMAALPMPFENDQQKRMYLFILATLVKKVKATKVILINEAWMATRNNLSDLDGPVRNQPDKEECIFVAGKTPKEEVVCIVKFSRVKTDEGKEVFNFEKPYFLEVSQTDVGMLKDIFPRTDKSDLH